MICDALISEINYRQKHKKVHVCCLCVVNEYKQELNLQAVVSIPIQTKPGQK